MISTERFASKVRQTSSCWEWTAGKNATGYAKFWYNGKTCYGHRFSYELHVGKIGLGLTIDHLCRNTSCVNPEHLEPVPLVENIKRKPRVSGLPNCRKGHLTPGNRTAKGYCRTCKNEHNKLYRANKKDRS